MSNSHQSQSKWTEQQYEAISYSGSDTLVSAAAGSGKTAVLVERIVEKVVSAKSKVNVNQLLIATFTKAAAAEMKERIREALEKEVFKNPSSKHLKRQLALLPHATITTIHSFCKEVIQRYYEQIDLDPSFRIANETESALLRQDVLEEIIEEQHQKADNAPFLELLNWFAGDRNDNALIQLVQTIYDAARSHPSLEGWLDSVVAMYEVGEDSQPLWIAHLIEDINLELESVKTLLEEAVSISRLPDGPTPYLENLSKELDALSGIASHSGEWEDLRAGLQQGIFDRLKPCKKDGFDEQKIEAVKGLRDKAKKDLEKLKGELFQRSLQDFIDECQQLKPIVLSLRNLVLLFHMRFTDAKGERNLLDFSDLEHLALKVLSEQKEGALVPSKAARDFQKIFKETLIDEYQDTNRVQEAILHLVSRSEPSGNRFMVGDVKQSIYRFRLAEPGLFLEKYAAYGKEYNPGKRIDLTKNFRSRRQVLDATNFVFRQIMSKRVAEVEYTADAELVFGATYYPETKQDYAVEMHLIDRTFGAANDDSDAEDDNSGNSMIEQELEGTEPARLEARYIAEQIKSLIGEKDGNPFMVYDKQIKGMRPIQYRDIVILLRSTQSWSPILLDEFKAQRVPAYADLTTGYFSATEVSIMMSLLNVIDNPFQDIPLAGVLRSPIVGLTGDDLAQIRLVKKRGRFYGALQHFLALHETAFAEAAATYEEGITNSSLKEKLERFMDQLDLWRNQARSGSLSDLIWDIYQVTGFYEFVGGLPGGQQRQANLRALFDRARQFESTSFRGLFRFLRFIERMKDSGTDLGAARSLGENEDVVRVMSIHKSKGLEFPVVFVAGLGKKFNQQDLTGRFLLHKEMGFGPKYTNRLLRMSYPSLPSLAIKRRMRLELLAEEMRVLYVALTRAREKLFLVGAVKDVEVMMSSWSKAGQTTGTLLPDHLLTKCSTYLDWIMMALSRHQGCTDAFGHGLSGMDDVSEWHLGFSRSTDYKASDASEAGMVEEERKSLLYAISRNQPVMMNVPNEERDLVSQIGWQYGHDDATRIFSKTSVTEMKRLGEAGVLASAGTDAAKIKSSQSSLTLRTPKFLSKERFTAAERGTFYHGVMQNFPLGSELKEGVDLALVQKVIAELVDRKLLNDPQAKCIDPGTILNFFNSPLGVRLLRAKEVMREVPFSYGIKAKELYPNQLNAGDEVVLIQGVIDCLFVDEDGKTVLLDFKTDRITTQTDVDLRQKYQVQIELYQRAINAVWSTVDEAFLFFFDKEMPVAM